MDYKKIAEEFMKGIFGKEPPFSPPDSMSKGEVGILVYLTFIKETALAGELSEQLNLSSGRIAIALKGLEKKGFVKRTSGISDRRQVIVSATEAGKNHAIAEKEEGLNKTIKLLESLGEHDALEFMRILYKIYDIKKEDR